ncbi:DedA family protein [Jiangella alkaliphila]|uniref:Membrane protein DedA, SNARE-associated domain n=1 Tax=Jiangella alkaliphila TaxID=419479 RepID=A0A1H2K9G4_9ACTN|nr:VTT domain-containing protein [Jiangella alkaliphila]SDU65203.1 membrane protein DedA, SNARE-associated domain [Jiangella alkaliphila]
MDAVTPLAAPDSPFGLPLWLGIAVMFGIVVARAQATYWLGRAAGTGIARSRWGDRLGRDRLARAEHVVARYGPVAVTLSFLTIGVQTAVNAVAGATRMPFGRYLAAMLVGSALWAVIWTVGGLSVLWGAATVASAAPLAAATVVLAAVVIVALIVGYRRRRATRLVPDQETR